MARTNMEDISDGELPRFLSGLGQTRTGRVFDDGPGTVTVLKQGTVAPRQVKQMQMLLNQFGYKLTVDGIFGAGSTAAVKAVQQKLSMAITGVYDKALDERIVGMNQSGIIDAGAKEVQLVALGEKTPQTATGQTTSGVTGTGQSITLVKDVTGKDIQVPPVLPGGVRVMTADFMARVKAKWAALRADKNFKFYVAGTATVVAVGGLFLLTPPKAAPPRPQQVNGYWAPPRKHKKRKSSKK